jgi:hypothetical protein
VTDFIWSLVVALSIAAFLVYATKRRWVVWRGGRSIANLTAFHEFQTKDKQEAIEITIEQKAGKQWKSQENGDGNDGEQKNDEGEITTRK